MKIALYSRKTDSGKLRLIFSYSCQTRRFFPTGVSIPPEDLYEERIDMPVRKTNPNAEHYNKQISLLYHELHQIISTLRREDKVPLADLVYKIFQDKKRIELSPVNNKTPQQVYKDFMAEKEFPQSTADLYDLMWIQLWACFPEFKFEEFTLHHWIRFRTYMKTVLGHSNNTIVIRLNKLKAMLRHLKGQGNEIPIDSFPLPKEEVKKVAMDLKDLQKVIDYVPSENKYQEIKDHLIIQCHTALRISDLKRISSHHFRDIDGSWYISMNAYKTNEAQMIPVKEWIMKIFRKYNFRMVPFSEGYYNLEIKNLLRMARVNTIFEWPSYDRAGKKVINKEPLYTIFTNHCCSRTAIAYFFSLGYAPDQVSRIVGKSMDTIMEYYYKKASSDDIVMRTRQFAINGANTSQLR